jgi:hypothetical protein
MTLEQSLKMKMKFSSVVEKDEDQMSVTITMWYILSRYILNGLDVDTNL